MIALIITIIIGILLLRWLWPRALELQATGKPALMRMPNRRELRL